MKRSSGQEIIDALESLLEYLREGGTSLDDLKREVGYSPNVFLIDQDKKAEKLRKLKRLS